MKKIVLFSFFVSLFTTISTFSQSVSPTPTPTRPRVSIPPIEPTPTPAARVIITNPPMPTPTPLATPRPITTPAQNPSTLVTPIYPFPSPTPRPQPTFYKPLTFAQIKSKIAEAKRQMQARPIQTAMTDSFLMTDVIRIAYYDYKANDIDYIVMMKTAFLDKNSREISTTTSNGNLVTVKNLRANGVNTPVMVIDAENKAHLPLLVQYPIERNGAYLETAYYISTHPGIVTPEVVGAGKIYIRSQLDTARTNLQKKGVFISPQVTDMAERLAVVEHVDHLRFRTEYHPTIYNDIYALFALNENQTYRYSVSSAGAGGMVQMIPWTYNMIRSRYYNVGLMPDFVEGMRNHPNAAQAMLLYMQMTWSDLLASETVSAAIANGIATPNELMSAGYNSNPAKLAGYIKRGGANWKNLIPKETQIYLQINASMDKFVPYLPRTK
ncbi:MAG: hypothetical protein LH614_09710 [Pyrinomonadaceae bacterium]|nr:hypothetical protein [Pyrinomonadaceae bacterium]